MERAISLEKISKTYHIPSIFPWKRSKKVDAVNNICITCPKEQITCLLGPNGAGKTTIIKILAGLVTPDSGDITIFGKPFQTNKEKLDFNIGFVTQNERSFYWRLTGFQNLDFYASLFNLKGKKKKQKIHEVLSEVNLENEADKPFRLYSAGMRQKLHIARALLSDPDILLLDEPTTHIDPIAQESIYNLIKIHLLKERKTTILLCTHNLHEAQKLADKIILLDKGYVLADGPISSLRSIINPNIKVIIEFSKLPKKEWSDDLPVTILNRTKLSYEFSIKNEKIIPLIISAAVKSGGEIIECKKSEESLLEIFTRLTVENK